MIDFAIVTDGITGQMTFDPASTIMNNIWLSLVIKKGSFFQNPDFGSRLHLLRRMKNTEKTAALAVDYCREALQWLLDTDRATSMDISYQRDVLETPNRLKVLISVTQANGQAVPFTYFVEVV